jgi:uncharacterized membrane protein
MWLLSITIVLSFLAHFEIIGIVLPTISVIITTFLQILTFINYIIVLIKQKNVKQPKYKINNIHDLGYVLFNTEYYLNKCKG